MESERERVNLAEVQQRKDEKWKRSGKGKGNRWLMLRDLLAIISMRPMGVNLVMDTMFLHRGLKRNTIREMLDQLERTKSIEQVKDASGSMPFWVWVATDGGVQFWIGSRLSIPAHIVQVAHTLTSVPVSGGIEK